MIDTPWHLTPKAGTGEQHASRSGARRHAMLPRRSVPGRLDSLRVIVIPAIGEETTVIASRTWCSVAIADVRNPFTGRQVADHGVSTGPEKAGKELRPKSESDSDRFDPPCNVV